MWSNQDFKTFNSFLGEGPDGDNTHMVEIWADNSTASKNMGLTSLYTDNLIISKVSL